eukprot:8102468-Pyramimonas_sp.AAC.1
MSSVTMACTILNQDAFPPSDPPLKENERSFSAPFLCTLHADFAMSVQFDPNRRWPLPHRRGLLLLVRLVHLLVLLRGLLLLFRFLLIGTALLGFGRRLRSSRGALHHRAAALLRCELKHRRGQVRSGLGLHRLRRRGRRLRPRALWAGKVDLDGSRAVTDRGHRRRGPTAGGPAKRQLQAAVDHQLVLRVEDLETWNAVATHRLPMLNSGEDSVRHAFDGQARALHFADPQRDGPMALPCWQLRAQGVDGNLIDRHVIHWLVALCVPVGEVVDVLVNSLDLNQGRCVLLHHARMGMVEP